MSHDKNIKKESLAKDIWRSANALPIPIKLWVYLILMPANIYSAQFTGEPMGAWVAFLANIGMILNIPVVIYDRGISKLMSLAHIVPWTLLVALIVYIGPSTDSQYGVYLWALLIINTISLIFDYIDSIKWIKGDRKVLGR